MIEWPYSAPDVDLQPDTTVALALTGASGMPYAIRLLQCLLAARCKVWLLYSQVAQVVAAQEMDLSLPSRAAEVEEKLSGWFSVPAGQLRVFGRDEWFAPIASGSNPADAMVVVPCSTGTLSAIASGACNNLIERAADVVLKERRRLVLLARETPLNQAHLRNMLAVTEMGGVICPPVPAFYQRPQTVDDIVDHTVSRLVDLLDLPNPLAPRWQGLHTPQDT